VHLKILHLTIARQLTAGQIKQLTYEHEAAKSIGSCSWVTMAYHEGEESGEFLHAIPLPFRGQFRRKLFAWLVMLRYNRNFDYVLIRHITFDPFSILFSPIIFNRSSVHHAKEPQELQLIRKDFRGKLASWLESVAAKLALPYCKAIFGVTLEIADYECNRYSLDKPICRYSNGILTGNIAVLADKRQANSINTAFICGTFSPWHGLDKVFKACQASRNRTCVLTIHLIGRLSPQQIDFVAINKFDCVRFVVHGHINEEQYRLILEECDYGIASLALHRQSLSEASTLKVREMLALGLPIYSGHHDIALPTDKNYVRITQDPSIDEMLEFGWHCKQITRQEVRIQSIPMIEKSAAMNKAITFLLSI